MTVRRRSTTGSITALSATSYKVVSGACRALFGIFLTFRRGRLACGRANQALLANGSNCGIRCAFECTRAYSVWRRAFSLFSACGTPAAAPRKGAWAAFAKTAGGF